MRERIGFGGSYGNTFDVIDTSPQGHEACEDTGETNVVARFTLHDDARAYVDDHANDNHKRALIVRPPDWVIGVALDWLHAARKASWLVVDV